MRFHALACDYDGTLARDGVVDEATREAVRQLRRSGRRFVLVTGRILPDLRAVFGELDLFDAVVAENGALLYLPADDLRTPLAPPPPPAFVQALGAKGVTPLDIGEAIVATWTPHEMTVVETIREFGLDLQVIFNKGAVMVLPAGVNKASGLSAWLQHAGISARSVVAVGDAENDLALLTACEGSAAVANALPSVQTACDLVLGADHGAGVRELIQRLLADDLRSVISIDERQSIPLGTANQQQIVLPGFVGGVLVAGTSGGGKTTIVSGIVERLADATYQCCIVDPEGDYEGLAGFVTLGDTERAPRLEEIIELVRTGAQLTINLLGISTDDRPAFATQLLAQLGESRAANGRPHWIVIDEAHHLLPVQNANIAIPAGQWNSVLFVTTRPSLVAASALEYVDNVIVVGDDVDATLKEAIAIIGFGDVQPESCPVSNNGDGALWRRSDPGNVRSVAFNPSKSSRRRHRRKYASGDLAPEKSFTFTGPQHRLHLQANNLQTFLRMADGVDEETWTFHRQRRDYSTWFQNDIGDVDFAEAAAEIENDKTVDSAESRKRIAALINERYTAPA